MPPLLRDPDLDFIVDGLDRLTVDRDQLREDVQIAGAKYRVEPPVNPQESISYVAPSHRRKPDGAGNKPRPQAATAPVCGHTAAVRCSGTRKDGIPCSRTSMKATSNWWFCHDHTNQARKVGRKKRDAFEGEWYRDCPVSFSNSTSIRCSQAAVPSWLRPETVEKLQTLLDLPVSESDEEGYVYINDVHGMSCFSGPERR